MAKAENNWEQRPTFYEFFAGGGMARAGLGERWRCLFANDFCEMKAATYAANWGSDDLICGDVAQITPEDLPDRADLAWASFPCQDLSLAGSYRGLGEAAAEVMTRSGTFWPFWSLMKSLRREGRAPRTIVLENVPGALTSRKGADFRALCGAFADANYRYGALLIDAKEFVPQSRQRLFFVAVAPDVPIPAHLTRGVPSDSWHPDSLRTAHAALANEAREAWLWWDMVAPAKRNLGFADIIEEHPKGCRWHSAAETQWLLEMMAPLHRLKVEQAQKAGTRVVGGIYKRTRPDERGVKRQRAEVRFDDVAGCLRTPAGGSSRQTILVVDGENIRSRLLSPREAARLMGLEDGYKLPERYNDAYHVAGDGVCVPVVRHLAEQVLEPILTKGSTTRQQIAA